LSPNFQGAPGMVLHEKCGRGSWEEARKLTFFVSRRIGQLCTMSGRLGTEQAIGTHIGAGRQCADTTETGVVAVGPTRLLYMGM